GECLQLRGAVGPRGRRGSTCGFLALSARAPLPPPAVLPRSAAAPRGRSPLGSHRQGPLSLPLHGGDVRLASLDFSPSLLGEWHEVPRGRGPQDRWETPGCLMARFARAPSPPLAVLPRFAAAPRGSIRAEDRS